MSGTIALVGGDEWAGEAARALDAELLAASGGREVLVVPTAAAYEHAERVVDRAREHFAALGAEVRSLPVLQRRDALSEEHAAAVAGARFVWVADGSGLHLRSVLKDSPVLEAVCRVWERGAVLVGSGESASALCDPMVDPRGGAFTVGLGLVPRVAVLPRTSPETAVAEHRRTLELADPGVCVVGVPEGGALVRDPGDGWRAAGAGTVSVFVGGDEVGLGALPA